MNNTRSQTTVMLPPNLSYTNTDGSIKFENSTGSCINITFNKVHCIDVDDEKVQEQTKYCSELLGSNECDLLVAEQQQKLKEKQQELTRAMKEIKCIQQQINYFIFVKILEIYFLLFF